ncbi:MAG: hypothetical protein ACI9R3_002780 [Verrucomicrobiales bacterium]|jgi:hypothetical protein
MPHQHQQFHRIRLLRIGLAFFLQSIVHAEQSPLSLQVESDRVSFHTETGRRYSIETSDDLSNWQQHGATITGSGYPHQHSIPHRIDTAYLVRVLSAPFTNLTDFQLKSGATIAAQGDAEAISAYDETTGNLEVAIADWPYTPGEVVVLPVSEATPRGALVRILANGETEADGKQILKTEPATLSDILQSGTIDHTRALTADLAGTPEILFSPEANANARSARDLLEGISLEADGGVFTITANDVPLLTTERGSLILDGSISLASPSVQLSMINEEGENTEFNVTVTSDINTNLEVRGNISIEESRTWELMSIPFATYQVGPILITPVIKIYVGASMDVNGDFICHVSQQSSTEFKLSYKRGDGWDSNRDAAASTGDVFIDASLQIEAEVFTGVAFELGLYNLVGPYFGIQGYYGFNADTSKIGTDDPWWNLEAGRRWVYGFDAEVFDAGQLFEKTFGSRVVEQIDSNDNYSVVSEGAPFWATSITGGDIDEIKSVSATSDGGILAAGQTKSFSDIPGNHYGGWLVKFDNSGEVDWQRSIWLENEVGDGYLQIKDVIAEPLPGGGYAIAGSWAADGAPTLPILIRMDEDGNVRFVKQYDPEPGTRRMAARALQILDNGSIALLAEYRMDEDSDGNDERYTAILCTALDGSPLWQQLYQPSPDSTSGELRHSIPNSMALTAGGGLAVLAHISGSVSAVEESKLVMTVSAEGEIDSARNFTGDGALGRFLQEGQIAVTASGDIVFSDWNKVVWLTPEGTMRWANHYNLVAIESMTSIGDNIVIAGELANVGGWLAELTPEGELQTSRVFTRPSQWRYVASDVIAHSDGSYTLGLREWGGFSPSEFWVIHAATGGTIDFDPDNGADVDFASVTARAGTTQGTHLEIVAKDLSDIGLTISEAVVAVSETTAAPESWAIQR